eukprot:3357929-Pleurochrysis_carterae.AAC.1
MALFTASAAAWSPPAAATKCATSRAGRCALFSGGSTPIVHSSPARPQAVASVSPGPSSACA